MTHTNVAENITNFPIFPDLCLNLQADVHYEDTLVTAAMSWGTTEVMNYVWYNMY